MSLELAQEAMGTQRRHLVWSGGSQGRLPGRRTSESFRVRVRVSQLVPMAIPISFLVGWQAQSRDREAYLVPSDSGTAKNVTLPLSTSHCPGVWAGGYKVVFKASAGTGR